MRRIPLSPESAEEASLLRHRIEIAHEVGAAILGADEDVFDTIESIQKFNHKLAKKEPDLYLGIAKLQGRLNSIMIDGFSSTPNNS